MTSVRPRTPSTVRQVILDFAFLFSLALFIFKEGGRHGWACAFNEWRRGHWEGERL